MKKGKKFNTIVAYFMALLLLTGAAIVVFAAVQLKIQKPEMEVLPQNRYEDTIIVAADMDYEPYSFLDENGQPAGYDMELIYQLANVMHKNVEIRLMPRTEAMAAVKSGEADVLTGLGYNTESLEEYELSMPFLNDPFVAFGKKFYSGMEEMDGKKLAVLDGNGSYTAVIEPFRWESRATKYDTYGEAFSSVESGENDYVITMYSVGRRVMARQDGSFLKAAGPVLAANYLCLGAKQGNTRLMNELNQGINQLIREGFMDSLKDKWLGRYVRVISLKDYISQNMGNLFLVFVIFILLIAAGIIVANRRLAKTALQQHEMTKRVLAYQQLITEATKGLYENIYELNITHNCAEGEATEQYFESLGIPGSTPLDQAVRTIARKQIKPEFIDGYVSLFDPKHVEEAFGNGIDRLSYDFMITQDGQKYYWIRVMARIFYWMEDETIRLIAYRQNIDEEKRKQAAMEEKIREDALTGLYNKITTETAVKEQLLKEPGRKYAFFMVDIDDFKQINDRFGHAFGDNVLGEFAGELKEQADGNIVGRIGGDEFVMLLPMQEEEWLGKKAAAIVKTLSREIHIDKKSCRISASMGVACYPRDACDFPMLYRKADKALYQTKEMGKNGFTVYDGKKEDE